MAIGKSDTVKSFKNTQMELNLTLIHEGIRHQGKVMAEHMTALTA